jgi:hypothetical protein
MLTPVGEDIHTSLDNNLLDPLVFFAISVEALP